MGHKNGIVVDSRKKQLMDLHRGNSWRYMEKHFFPLLRRSLVEVQYVSLLPAAGTEQVPEPDAEQTDTVEMPQPLTPVPASKTEAEDSRMISEPQQQPPFYMAVKTNLLYDALLVPNAGVEFIWAKASRQAEAGCTHGGRRTDATATGESTEANWPYGNTSAARKEEARSADTIWECTDRYLPTTSKPEGGDTWAANRAARCGKR